MQFGDLIWLNIFDVVIPVVAALGLGILFSLHPARRAKLRKQKLGGELLQAQVLICMAGALMVVVIGSGEAAMARAFGLLGLGSFIRFRTAVKSPADTAIFFLLIGIGMACGIGRYGAAVLGTLMLMALLSALERTSFGQVGEEEAPVDETSRSGE